jgi:hypothetical protein
MSSTSNLQSLLAYVLRPSYTYSNGAFTTAINLSNISRFTADTVTYQVLYVGDPSNNVYIGSNAGNYTDYVTTCNASGNTAAGVLAANGLSNSSNSEFFGYYSAHGASNVNNSIVLGAYAGYRGNTITNSILIGTSNASTLTGISNTITIGTSAGGGSNNIYIGANTGSNVTGRGNVFIGHGLNNSISGLSAFTNKLVMGGNGNVVISADFSNGVVAFGTTNTNANYSAGGPINSSANGYGGYYGMLAVDVAGWTRISNTSVLGGAGLTINTDPWVPSTGGKWELDVNGHFRVYDGYGLISMSNNLGGTSTASNIQLNIVNVSNQSSTTIPVGSTMQVNVGSTDVAGNPTGSLAVTGSITASTEVRASGYSSAQGTLTFATNGSSNVPNFVLKKGSTLGTVINTAGPYFSNVLITNTANGNSVYTLNSLGALITVSLSGTTVVVAAASGATFPFYVEYNFTSFPVS